MDCCPTLPAVDYLDRCRVCMDGSVGWVGGGEDLLVGGCGRGPGRP